MTSFLECIFGYSPQMILSVSTDNISLRSKKWSKFIVLLMLLLMQFLILPLFMPIEQVLILTCIPIIGGLTYSKAFIFDRTTFKVTVRRKMFGMGLKKEIKFDEIACVKAESNPLRKGTYLFLRLKNHKKLLLDMTTDKGYVDTVIDAINKVRNPTCH